MYTQETWEIASNLWNDAQVMEKMIAVLSSILATKRRGIVYSYQDFDIKQGLAADLTTLASNPRALVDSGVRR